MFVPASGAKSARFEWLDIREDLTLQSSDEFVIPAETVNRVKVPRDRPAVAKVTFGDGETIAIHIMREQ